MVIGHGTPCLQWLSTDRFGNLVGCFGGFACIGGTGSVSLAWL